MKPGAYGPFPYSPIIRRPPLAWPGGARVALWIIPNIEFFALDEKVPAASGGSGGRLPDVPGWASRDYGNRVGVFRLMRVLDRYAIRGTVALNSDLCARHPEIIEEGQKRHWEWMGHNESNTRRLNEVPPEEEPRVIADALAEITRATGTPPVGWLGSGLQETWNTLDHLAANGVEYVCDWVNDDQPYVMSLDGGRRIVAMPYSYDINDKPAYERMNHHPRPNSPQRHDLPPVRRVVGRGRRVRPGDGDRAPPLSFGHAAPHRRARPGARAYLPPRFRVARDRRRDHPPFHGAGVYDPVNFAGRFSLKAATASP